MLQKVGLDCQLLFNSRKRVPFKSQGAVGSTLNKLDFLLDPKFAAGTAQIGSWQFGLRGCVKCLSLYLPALVSIYWVLAPVVECLQ
jgi:hypothetical protein